MDDISYNFASLSKYYADHLRELIEESFFEGLSFWPIYFEPLVFNEKTALECGLIPFSFEGIKLLSLAGYGMDLSPKLDAYQVLTNGSIDKKSKYFRKRDKAHFEDVVSRNVYEKMGQILAK
jgi:hypothetical protein